MRRTGERALAIGEAPGDMQQRMAACAFSHFACVREQATLLLTQHAPSASLGQRSGLMSFILGSILFIAVVGKLDARLPWPSAGAHRAPVRS